MNSSQNAIAVLYRKYWQKLYIHAYNLLNDGESAKDVLSDVFCSVLENSEQFEGKTDLLPLFYVMVKNRCIDTSSECSEPECGKILGRTL